MQREMWGPNYVYLIFSVTEPQTRKSVDSNQKGTAEFLNHTPNTSRLDLNAFAFVARVFAGISRSLLMVAAVSLITMPYTQHIWAWDHFLHGGQDFEFGVLAIMTSLCLVLLLAQHSKQSIDLLFANWRRCSFICNERVLASTTRSEPILAFHRDRGASLALALYTLPIQI